MTISFIHPTRNAHSSAWELMNNRISLLLDRPTQEMYEEAEMSGLPLRTIIGLVLVIHGIGHAMAFVPALGIFSTENWHYRSWLISGVIGDPASRVLSIILFGVTLLGFIAAGLGVFGWLGLHPSWRTMATAAAVISLVALALFWNSFAALFPNKIGAIAVNVATLVCILWMKWPAEALLGY